MKQKNTFLVYRVRTVDPEAQTTIILPSGDEYNLLEVLRVSIPLQIGTDRYALVYLNCEGAITAAQVAEIQRMRGMVPAEEVQ